MSRKTEILIVIVIILVAGFFRLWQLDVVPPGLYPDEAINGNDAVQVVEDGNFKVFYSENNGREGLFINLAAFSLKVFDKSVFSLRLVSALAGILTVLFLYLFTKELFNRNIAAISSFMLAISFWHVNFSRIGFRAILAPLILTIAFYFFWRGLRTSHLLHFGLSGIFWGLGFYAYISFRIAPLILIFVLLAYWQKIKKDFGQKEYLELRNKIIRGFALLMITAILVALPLGIYYLNNPADFLGRTGQLSIFSSENPLLSFGRNIFQSLAMFNFTGDWNWRHNFAGSPQLMWPMGALFVVGFIKTWTGLFRYKSGYRKNSSGKKVKTKKHDHFAIIPVMLLSWFFIMLLPVAFSNEGIPHALRAIIVIPPVFIMAGKGTWWLFEYLRKWYSHRDAHPREAVTVVSIVLIIFLASLGFAEYGKYFNQWANKPETAGAFNKKYVDIGNQLNKMSPAIKKYVLVNAGGTLVNNIPMPAQTVMFITDTATADKQKEKNIFYLTQEQFDRGEYDWGAMVIPLEE